MLLPLASSLLTAVLLQAGPVLTLEEALSRASQQNLDLAAARERLTQARQLGRKAWSGYLPQVSASGTYTYNSTEAKLRLPGLFVVREVGVPVGPPTSPQLGGQTDMIAVPDPEGFIEADIQKRHQFSGTIQASQALLAPSLWTAIRSAYLAEDLAVLTVENARVEILFAVAQQYYGAEMLRESLEIQERLLEVTRQHQHDAELAFRAGTGPEIAALRAQMATSSAEQDLVRTRNSYEASLSALATTLDMEPTFAVARPTPPAAPPDGEDLAAEALQRRPDVQAARKGVTLAEQERRGVWARYAPTLGLFARYNVQNAKGFTGEYGTWTAGLAANWNLWDGGLREAELKETSSRIAERRASLRAQENRTRDEIRRASLELQSAEANRAKAQEQVRLAQKNANLVRLSFEAGSASSLDAVDANASLRTAELTLITEQLNAQLAAVKLAKAAGRYDSLGITATEKP